MTDAHEPYSKLLASVKPAVISFLREFASSHITDSRLRAASLHLLGLGKLVRPAAVIASAQAFSPDITLDACLHTATAMEFIHTFTLIHDDLPEMDDAKLRRGVPAVHIAFGADIALLAGDGLFNLALAAIAEDPHLTPELRMRLIREIITAVSRVIEGQTRELALSGKTATLAEIEDVERLKTGELFSCALVCGALLGGASEDDVEAVRNFALLLGHSFQIKDDLLSATGDNATVGKSLEQDVALERPTIVRLLGVDGALRRYEEINAATLAALDDLMSLADTSLLRGLHESLVCRQK